MISDNGEYLARSSVLAVNELSKETNEIKDQMDKFTKNLESRIGNNINLRLNQPIQGISITHLLEQHQKTILMICPMRMTPLS